MAQSLVKYLKEKPIFIANIAIAFLIFVYVIISIGGIAIKPNTQVISAVEKVLSGDSSLYGEFKFSASKEDTGDFQNENFVWLALNSLNVDGKFKLYGNPKKIKLKGAVKAIDENILPIEQIYKLPSYEQFRKGADGNIDKEALKELLKKVSRKRESRYVKVGKTKIPYMLEVYRVTTNLQEISKILKKDFLKYLKEKEIGAFKNMDLKDVELTIKLMLDKEHDVRGFEISGNYKDISFEGELTVIEKR